MANHFDAMLTHSQQRPQLAFGTFYKSANLSAT